MVVISEMIEQNLADLSALYIISEMNSSGNVDPIGLYTFFEIGVIQPPEMIENWNAFGLNLSQMLEPIGKRQFFGDFSFSILMGSN